MRSLYFKKTWLMLGFGLVLVTLVLMLIPNAPSVKVLSFFDKIEHVSAFLVLMMWFAQLFHRSYHVWIAIALILFGVTAEFLQEAGGHRTFEVGDIAADMAGVLIGWLLGATSLARLLIHLENSYLKRSHSI